MMARTSVPRSTARQARLVAQLDARRERQHARHRRVVHREDRAERRGGGEHVGQPCELLVAQLAVVEAGNGRVEGDEPQPVELVDAVDGPHRVGGALVEQPGAERRAVVVVAHHPEHARAEPRGERLDERAQFARTRRPRRDRRGRR